MKESKKLIIKRKKSIINNGRGGYGRFGRVGGSPGVQALWVRNDMDSMNLSPESKDLLVQFLRDNNKRHDIKQRTESTALTPGDTQLKRAASLGPFYCYSSALLQTPVRVNVDKLESIDETAEYLVTPGDKQQSYDFNKATLQKVRAQKNKQKGRRKTGQSKAIARKITKTLKDGSTYQSHVSTKRTSANVIAAQYNIKQGRQKFEWTHLIAYRFLGEKGQHGNNLVLATKQCNSLMMIFEDALVELCEELPNKNSIITLIATAEVVPKTHVATAIYYHMISPDLNLDLKVKFDPQMTNNPTKDFEEAVSAMIAFARHQKRHYYFGTPIADKKAEIESENEQDDPGTPVNVTRKMNF